MHATTSNVLGHFTLLASLTFPNNAALQELSTDALFPTSSPGRNLQGLTPAEKVSEYVVSQSKNFKHIPSKKELFELLSPLDGDTRASAVLDLSRLADSPISGIEGCSTRSTTGKYIAFLRLPPLDEESFAGFKKGEQAIFVIHEDFGPSQEDTKAVGFLFSTSGELRSVAIANAQGETKFVVLDTPQRDSWALQFLGKM